MRPNLEIPPNDRCKCSNVYLAFKNWYLDNVGIKPSSRQEFRREIMNCNGWRCKNEFVKKTHGGIEYFVFTLNKQAIEEYLP
jgi:hypothetical protein